jgi:hypothetical protein
MPDLLGGDAGERSCHLLQENLWQQLPHPVPEGVGGAEAIHERNMPNVQIGNGTEHLERFDEVVIAIYSREQ